MPHSVAWYKLVSDFLVWCDSDIDLDVAIDVHFLSR